ncbi:glycine cleavage system aminomethyltransferase GcvT [Citricoccus sp.]|uniref:glycine cleavage system aminomethyltransferase GcvT n=1 Tax=Citricoccus sp. TaxID=1978372 RepID=UPI002603CCE8|nr:glycine cleavage system aminomethyltransferase GcvT [Citricoccus sp.]HRO31141.1 glycine cleavage system aminomethyltransferase GcvT [Citricoccus sp.]HRO94636.1 glycine cleavage system aminomethyltransferase GcvT [Citricoccus sp.]
MSPNQDLRTTPLHAVHAEAGATFTDFGGWQMPLKYGSELSEHHAVRKAAGLFDLSHMGEVRVTGPQAAEALDYALTARVSNVAPGRAKYSLICTEAGTILDDLIVYRLDDGQDDSAREYLVVPNAGNASSVAAALTERSVGFEATVRNESAQTALVAIQGPEAARVLSLVLPEDEAAALPELKYYAARTVTVRTGTGEVPVLLARTGYTGEDGFELIIGPVADRDELSAAATAVWHALSAAGAEAGVEVLPCGLASRDSLRLEAGMPLYGNELDLGHLPSESGAGMAVPLKSKETDFVGRDALLAAREAGTGTTSGQAIVALRAAGRRAARAGYAVLDGDGNRIGEVTSGIPSPTLGYPIALARVDVTHREPGTEVAVDLRGKAEPFTVVELPFYRRQD